jgi:SnoaL-like domain
MNTDHIDLQAMLNKLEELDAKEQIRSVISRYPRGVDRTDPSVTQSTMWPDARLVDGHVQGNGTADIDRLIGEYVATILASTHHMNGNMIIDVKGNFATAETYAIVHHRTYPTPESNDAVVGARNLPQADMNKEHELIIGMRYLDRFEKRGGIWKIIERKLVFDWSQRGIYSGIDSGGLYDGTPFRGKHRSDDPSYQS